MNKKMNKKGFVFIETITVLVVVILSLTLMSANYVLLRTKSKAKLHYDRTNELYALRTFMDIGVNELNNYGNIVSYLNLSGTKDYIVTSTTCDGSKLNSDDSLSFNKFVPNCNDVLNTLNIKTLLITSDIDYTSKKYTSLSTGMIKYLEQTQKSDYYVMGDEGDSSIRKRDISYVVGEFYSNNEYYYASIKIGNNLDYSASGIAVVSILKNGYVWDNNQINIALYQDGVEYYNMSDTTRNRNDIEFHNVSQGSYEIYASKSSDPNSILIDTGVVIDVFPSGIQSINYHSLQIDRKDSHVTSVIGIGEYFSNQRVKLTAIFDGGYEINNWSVISGNTPDNLGVNPTTILINQMTHLEVSSKGIPYSIGFDGNGHTSGSMSIQTGFIYGTPKALNQNLFEKDGYVFLGWSKEKDGALVYNDKEQIINGSDSKGTAYLYALWDIIRYTVVFDGNGSTSGSMDAQNFAYNQSKNLLPNAYEKAGYQFIGWGMSSTDTNPTYLDEQNVKNITTVEGAIVTLYALWEENEVNVNIYKDNSSWTSSGIQAALYQNGVKKYAYTDAVVGSSSITWNQVLKGSYNLYASKSLNDISNLVDTGIIINLNNGGVSNNIIYYDTLTVTKDANINTVTAGGVYLRGTNHTLVATPKSGYRFKEWEVTSGNINLSEDDLKNSTINFNILSPLELKATSEV